jgi:hypothetical protein
VTMAIIGIGSVLTAAVDNYSWFVIARTITGIGIGADLAIVNINEMAPRHGRARYTALIFLFSALGAVLGIWLGLWLTTPATPLPMGLPFAVTGPGFEYGWRIMYLIGGLLALVGVLLRFQLPESARWLIARGRLDAASTVIDIMEHRASARISLPAVERPAVVRVVDSTLLGDTGRPLPPRRLGSSQRAVMNAVLIAEGIRNAQKLTGKKLIDGADMRRGLESLNISEARWKELGLPGFAEPIHLSCTDHNGHNKVFLVQWDGRWTKEPGSIEPIHDKIQPLIEQAAEKYVKANAGWPKRTEACDKTS